MKGASQECYIAADGLAAGQTADGLIDYRLEMEAAKSSLVAPSLIKG